MGKTYNWGRWERFKTLSNKLPQAVLLFSLLLAPLTSTAETAPTYSVDSKASFVTFKAIQQNVPTTGSFTVQGIVRFDPNHLDASVIDVFVPLRSLTTSYDEMKKLLLTPDWLSAKKYPLAHFKSNSITKVNDTHYLSKGSLTIQNITKPISFTFILDNTAPESIKAHTDFSFKRLDYKLGKGPWKATQAIKNDVTLQVVITAQKTTPLLKK